VSRLEKLWADYEKNQMGASRRLEEEHPEVLPRTKLEEIWAWEDYAAHESVKWSESLVLS